MTPKVSPERALELANKVAGGGGKITQEDDASIIAILRAYADLAQKWQAVLDAEPVAESYAHHSAGEIGYCKFFTSVDRGELLIIKPTA